MDKDGHVHVGVERECMDVSTVREHREMRVRMGMCLRVGERARHTAEGMTSLNGVNLISNRLKKSEPLVGKLEIESGVCI